MKKKSTTPLFRPYSRPRGEYISMLRPRTESRKPYEGVYKRWVVLLEEALKEMEPYVLLSEEERAWMKDSKLKPWSLSKYAILQFKLNRLYRERYGKEEEEEEEELE